MPLFREMPGYKAERRKRRKVRDEGDKPRSEPPKSRRYERYNPETGRTTVIWTHRDLTAESKRSDTVQAPYTIGDNVEYQSMVDGSWITGKRQHREHLREHDCEEVGNERMPFQDTARERAMREMKETIGQDIKDAYDQVEAGYVAGPEPEPDADLPDFQVSDDVQTGDVVRENVPQKSTIIETV